MPQPPACVGHFDAQDVICNGDPQGASVEERAPCAWRNRCAGLQILCEETGQASEIIVASLAYPALVALCETKIREHHLEDGLPRPTKQERREATAASSPPVEEVRERKSNKRRVAPRAKHDRYKKTGNELPDDAKALHDHFEQVLRDFFPERRFGTGKRVLIKPGTFYPIDRVAGSQYVSWYCTVAKGRDIALACVRVKPRILRADIQLTVSVEELRKFLGAKTFKKLSPCDFKDGQFKLLCKRLDREGIALCAETIRKLAETDILVLP